MEDLTTQIEEEEAVIRQELSLRIAEFAEVLKSNCHRIGCLDVAVCYQCHVASIVESFENSSGLLLPVAKEFWAVISQIRKGLLGFILFQSFRYRFIVTQISQ